MVSGQLVWDIGEQVSVGNVFTFSLARAVEELEKLS